MLWCCLLGVLGSSVACRPESPDERHAPSSTASSFPPANTLVSTSSPDSAAQPPPPSESASAVDATTGLPPKRGPSLPTNGFIEIEERAEVRRLAGPCQHGYEFYDPMPAPYAEVLDPDSNTPRFIIDSCGASGVPFSIVGTTVKLPGPVKGASLSFRDPATGQEWLSESVKLEVTKFGDINQMVAGTFEAVMGARLNRPAVTIRGRFELPRAADRYRP